MPITLPNLDDRKYTDLVEEARALIPTDAPEWTNHNPSDPGITLIELFAFLSEMLIYRLNRVTDENVYAFLKLINGPNWKPAAQKSLTEQIRETILLHREPSRAITSADFERLALTASKDEVARAHCVPRRNLESISTIDKPGHVSVIIVPDSKESNPQPSEALKQKVKGYLEPRRLLTTQVHVVGPRYFTIGIRLTIVLKPDAPEDTMLFNIALEFQSDLDSKKISEALRQVFRDHGISFSPEATVVVKEPDRKWLITDEHLTQTYTVRKEEEKETKKVQLNVYEDTARSQAINAILRFLHPLIGGSDGTGWPFGRNVYVSEIYELLDTLPGIDYVEKSVDPETQKSLDELTVDINDTRLQRDAQGELIAVKIQSDELVNIPKGKVDLTIKATRQET